MAIYYHHDNSGGVTPRKIKELFYGDKKNVSITISITPEMLVVRAYDSTLGIGISKAVMEQNWEHKHCWKDIPADKFLPGEMAFSFGAGHTERTEEFWGKAGFLRLEPAGPHTE